MPLSLYRKSKILRLKGNWKFLWCTKKKLEFSPFHISIPAISDMFTLCSMTSMGKERDAFAQWAPSLPRDTRQYRRVCLWLGWGVGGQQLWWKITGTNIGLGEWVGGEGNRNGMRQNPGKKEVVFDMCNGFILQFKIQNEKCNHYVSASY